MSNRKKKMTLWVLPSVFNIIIFFLLLTCMEFLFILDFKILSLDAALQTYSTVLQAFLSHCWLVDLLFWSFMCPHSFIFAFIVCSSGVIVKANVKDHFSQCFRLGVSQYLVFISESSIHFMFTCTTESKGAEIKVQIQPPMCENQFSLCIYWNSPCVSTVFLVLLSYVSWTHMNDFNFHTVGICVYSVLISYCSNYCNLKITVL